MSAISAGKERIARIVLLQAAQQIERPRGLALVPQVDQVELIVRLALEQAAAVPRAQHLREPFRLVPARQHEEEAQNLGRRRRDVRVVLVEPDAEVRILEAGRSSIARSSACLMRLPSRAAATRSSRSTRHCTRAAYAPPR